MKLKYVKSPELKSMGISLSVVAKIYGVNIHRENSELEALKQKAALELRNMSDQSIQNNPILQSYRDLVKKIDRSPRKFSPSAESLIESVRRVGHFPLINVAVD